MVRYWILRKIILPANFETASWFRPRRGKLKRVKCNIVVPAAQSLRKTSIRKIMKDQARQKENELRRAVEGDTGKQPVLPPPPTKPAWWNLV